MNILVLNAGSSTHKLALFRTKRKGEKETSQIGQEPVFEQKIEINEGEDTLENLLVGLWTGEKALLSGPEAIDCIGHRVVHGGPYFSEPVLITPKVKERIASLIPLAPVHNRANLDGIELMEKLFPGAKQVAVFDTAFHRTLPEVAKTYPLPREWREKGIQRYGFHGISHHYCSERLVTLLGKGAERAKIVNCHLGNGVSLCAIEGGKSRETTMGFTPLEGAMMGTRCGSIDPSISFFLQREAHLSPEEIEHGYNTRSGLKGIAGASDMRALLSRQDPEAKFALEMYTYRIRAYIGMLAATLGGLDILSFTGGIGENAAPIRAMICQPLTFLGIDLDEKKNHECKGEGEIGRANSSVKLWAIKTREEWMIVRACLGFIDK